MYDLRRVPRDVAIGLVHFYQRGLSPLIGPRCRYTPSCSHYMIEAIEKHGLMRGLVRGLWRILRCNPFSSGGYAPP
jgi:putative membrane protein insertion efficiency factor